MAILGARQLVDLAVPTGLDGSRIFQFQLLRSNLTPEQVMTQAAATIGAVNEQIASLYGGMTYMSEQMFAYDRQGEATRTMTPLKAEGKKADPVKATNIGHMWPINDYEDALGWSRLYLRDAFQGQIDADIAQIGDRWVNRVDLEFWTRVLTDTENAIGSAGYDVGWAVGTGDSVNFIPPQWMNYTFDATHIHYKGVAGTAAADWGTLLNTMSDELRHHGHTGRLVAFVNSTNASTIAGMTTAGAKFVELNPQNFTMVGGNSASPIQITTGEIQGVPGELFGYFNGRKGLVELRYYDRVPAGYVWMTKVYGNNNPRNGVVIRTHPGEAQGFGLVMAPQMTNDIQPELDRVLFRATHGIGVNDRTNGVAGMVGNATYQNPTVS